MGTVHILLLWQQEEVRKGCGLQQRSAASLVTYMYYWCYEGC